MNEWNGAGMQHFQTWQAPMKNRYLQGAQE